MLVIDEADRILEVGFEEEMKRIISILPKGTPLVSIVALQFLIALGTGRRASVNVVLGNTNYKSCRFGSNIAKTRPSICGC